MAKEELVENRRRKIFIFYTSVENKNFSAPVFYNYLNELVAAPTRCLT